MIDYGRIMGDVGTAIDGVGVAVIAIGAAAAGVRALFAGSNRRGRSYALFRQDLGKVILLGLELLIAGDIIRTVVVAPTITNVLVLGMIVIIRTFLSMTLQLELEGRWPWQPARPTGPPSDSHPESASG